MRQHSKVVHASSGGEDHRAAKVQERMANSISVEWGAKRVPQNPPVFDHLANLMFRGKLFRNSESRARN
jgi:hypothetical protein